jgi:hypothetical protein
LGGAEGRKHRQEACAVVAACPALSCGSFADGIFIPVSAVVTAMRRPQRTIGFRRGAVVQHRSRRIVTLAAAGSAIFRAGAEIARRVRVRRPQSAVVPSLLLTPRPRSRLEPRRSSSSGMAVRRGGGNSGIPWRAVPEPKPRYPRFIDRLGGRPWVARIQLTVFHSRKRSRNL